MIRRFFILCFFCVVMQWSCNTGKRALNHGDYDLAVEQASNTLTNNPKNKKALSVLQVAYPMSENKHNEKIALLKQSSAETKWEQILEEYQTLYLLKSKIYACHVCRSTLVLTEISQEDYRDALEKACDWRYNQGDKFMLMGGIDNLRIAYEHFLVLEQMNPDYKDLKERLEQCRNRLSTPSTPMRPSVRPRRYYMPLPAPRGGGYHHPHGGGGRRGR